MRRLVTVTVVLVLMAVLLAAFWLHVPWERVATPALVALCLGWLVVVLTLPWNLYFHAKAVLFELQRSRERGIAVKNSREEETRAVARRMLRVSIALHVGSAALAAGVTAATQGKWGYLFSGFYLLTGFFRPAVEYYRYVRERLGLVSVEARVPREDAAELRAAIERIKARLVTMNHDETALRARLTTLEKSTEAWHAETDRRITSLARTFEQTVDRLTDNQQIIGGIKAFLRLVQQGEPGRDPGQGIRST